MITSIRFLDTHYSGLEEIFPVGNCVGTNSGVVLIAGPNYRGKSALLRMLFTSLSNEAYFREHGISRYWETSGLLLNSLHLADAQEVESGWYDSVSSAEELSKIIRASNQLNVSPDVELETREIRLPGKFVDTKVMSTDSLKRIVAKSRECHDVLEAENAKNIWGYIIPTIEGGDIYLQQFMPSFDNMQRGLVEVTRKEMEFSPDYDGRKVRKRGGGGSPGKKVMYKVETAFDNIHAFFMERKNPINPLFAIDGHDRRVASMVALYTRGNEQAHYMQRAYTHSSEPFDVAEGSQLVVFMDEPTAFLDYRNKYAFRDMLMQVIEKYAPNLQVFVATNDPILIEKTPNGRYIDLYQTPAQSVSEFEAPL